mmetsp:Transcript_45726/g.110807  ORF Transcript_45726/g.110807 Transcript_45726/m.110807 type:complete len:82 (+) Transcript_45726:346-591(+)
MAHSMPKNSKNGTFNATTFNDEWKRSPFSAVKQAECHQNTLVHCWESFMTRASVARLMGIIESNAESREPFSAQCSLLLTP